MKQPYAFQQQAIERGLETNIFLQDECGCGKKLTMLEIARHIRDERHEPTLVVTTKRDTLQWKREVLGQDPTIPIVIGTVDALWVPDVSDWWLIMHYEAVVRHVRSLRRVKFGTVILDEGHAIKNWQAQRTKAVKQLQAHRKIVGTGTPMDRSPGDLWSPLEFLFPEKYRGTRRAFCDKHERFFIDTAGYRRVMPGPRSQTALSAELAPFTFARTKRDVAPELPPNIEKEVYIELTGPQRTLYERIRNAADIVIDGPELEEPMMIGNGLAQMIREQQAALDPSLVRATAESAKLEWLQAWMEANSEEPVIIFTNYRAVAEKVAAMYKAHLIAGGVALPAQWTRRTIVGTIKACSEALDLGFIPTAIFLDVNYSQLRMTQAINRIHRLGNTQPSETIYLTAANTIDEILMASWREKWDKYQTLKAYISWRQGAPFPRPAPARPTSS